MGSSNSVLKTEEVTISGRTYCVRLCNTYPMTRDGPGGRINPFSPGFGNPNLPAAPRDVLYETRTIYVEEKFNGGKWKRVWSDKTFERPGRGDPLDTLDKVMSDGKGEMNRRLAKFRSGS